MLNQYGNNCYLTSFLHLVSLTPGDWKCYEKYQCVGKMIDNLQQDKYEEEDDKLAQKIYNTIKRDGGGGYKTVEYAKKYLLEQLGLKNDIVSFGFKNSNTRFVISEIEINITKQNQIIHEFNPLTKYDNIKKNGKKYKVIGFILSTGNHHFVIGRLKIYDNPNSKEYRIDFCKLDPLNPEQIVKLNKEGKKIYFPKITQLTKEEKKYYSQKIDSSAYQVGYVLYEKEEN